MWSSYILTRLDSIVEEEISCRWWVGLEVEVETMPSESEARLKFLDELALKFNACKPTDPAMLARWLSRKAMLEEITRGVARK